MDSALLNRLRAFHRHLISLAATGVSLDLGKKVDAPSVMLEQIESRLEVRIGLGQTIEQAIEAEHELPSSYRCAVLIFLASDNSAQALEAITKNAGGTRRFRRSLFQSLVTPVIIGGLVCGGVICLCVYTAPRFEALYGQIQQAPSTSLLVLRWLRTWLFVWAPLTPVVLLLGVWFAHRAEWPRLLQWAPAMRGFTQDASRATFVSQLSRLSENELPLALAAPLAKERSSELGWKDGAEAFVAAIASFSSSDDESNANVSEGSISAGRASTSKAAEHGGQLPPLLRWSLSDQAESHQLTDNLRFTADMYDRSARRRAKYWGVAGPVFASALIGGGVLLAYGCALFMPFTSLMQDLSQASSSSEIEVHSRLSTGVVEQ